MRKAGFWVRKDIQWSGAVVRSQAQGNEVQPRWAIDLEERLEEKTGLPVIKHEKLHNWALKDSGIPSDCRCKEVICLISSRCSVHKVWNTVDIVTPFIVSHKQAEARMGKRHSTTWNEPNWIQIPPLSLLTMWSQTSFLISPCLFLDCSKKTILVFTLSVLVSLQ